MTGYVTVSLHAVTLPQALAAILAPLGDTFRAHGGVYDVEPGPSALGAGAASAGMAPSVLPVTVVPVQRAAAQVRALFPQASVREDARSNALLVVAPPADVQAMRTVLQGIDVRSPTAPVTEALGTHTVRADAIVAQLHGSFPAARIAVVGPRQLLITALPSDLAQIRAALTALDAPTATPPPVAVGSDAVRVTQRRPADVARALSRQVAGLRACSFGKHGAAGRHARSGQPRQDARRAARRARVRCALHANLPHPQPRRRVASPGLLRRSFRDAEVTVDAAINALAVTATAAEHQRIADAVAQLDPAPGTGGNFGSGSFAAGSSTELVTLKSAVPGQTTGGAGRRRGNHAGAPARRAGRAR